MTDWCLDDSCADISIWLQGNRLPVPFPHAAAPFPFLYGSPSAPDSLGGPPPAHMGIPVFGEKTGEYRDVKQSIHVTIFTFLSIIRCQISFLSLWRWRPIHTATTPLRRVPGRQHGKSAEWRTRVQLPARISYQWLPAVSRSGTTVNNGRFIDECDCFAGWE